MYVASDVDLISWIVKNQRWLMNRGRSNRLDVKNILSELTTQVHSNMFKIDHTLYAKYVVHIQIISKLLHLSDFLDGMVLDQWDNKRNITTIWGEKIFKVKIPDI